MAHDITQLRYQTLLKRLLGLKGGDSGGRLVSPEIAPSFEVNDQYQPEARYLRGERLYACAARTTNTNPSTFGTIALQNPFGSGKVWVVRRITWSLLMPTSVVFPGVCFIALGRFSALAGGSVSNPNKAKDSRAALLFGVNADVGSCGLTTGFATGTNSAFENSSLFYESIQPGATAVPYVKTVDTLDLVLGPGSQLAAFLGSDSLLTAAFNWNLAVEGYERVLDGNETNLPQY